MELKTQEVNCKTPTKKIFAFHGILGQTQCNYYETPPRVTKIKNPFEHLQHEHLGTNFISPSLFAKRTPVKKDFTWTIDELSVLKPAEIDEHSNQFSSPEREEHYDHLTQSKIDSYFSMQQILPSPMQPCEGVPLIKLKKHIQSPHSSVSTCTSSSNSPITLTSSSYTQTVLSLPPLLPDEVEQVLKPYFNFTQDQHTQQNIMNDGTSENDLYKKLFDEPTSPRSDNDNEDIVQANEERVSSPVRECRLSFMQYKHSSMYQRTIGTPGNYDEMNLCPLSPICLPLVNVEEGADKDIIKNSSQVMSMDGSFNVPDCSKVEKLNHSQLVVDSSHHSSESLSTSTINWDLEYKQMSSPLPSTQSLESMEMSRLITPKQRIMHSQRKKLSDSFRNDVVDESDEDDFMIISQQSMKADGESGYDTNISFMEPQSSKKLSVSSTKPTDNCSNHFLPRSATAKSVVPTSMWQCVDVVSSTPTKRKQCFL